MKELKAKKNLLLFKTLILLLYVISFSYPAEIKKISFKDGFSETYTATEIQTFQISFSNIDVPNYLHVIVETTKSDNQIVYFSNTDSSCGAGRQLMAQKFSGPVDLFLNEKQITNKNVYICVQCQGNKNCQFKMTLLSEDSCMLTLPGQYTYYVSNEDNEEMSFVFSHNKDESLSSTIGPEDKSFLTIWAKGNSNSIETSLSGKSSFKKEFDFGDIYTFEDGTENSSNYLLNVKAHVGDLITVGGNYIEQGVSKIRLIPNQQEILGYLKKGEHEIECYSLEKDPSIQYSNEDPIYLSGLAFSRIFLSYYANSELELIDYTQKTVIDGTIHDGIYINEMDTKNYYCFSFPDDERFEINEITYSLILTDHKHMKIQNIYSPQLLGMIYPHYLHKGEIGIYSAVTPSEEAKYINYNLFSIYGFPDMLYDECETFPNCQYDNEKLKKIKNPHHIHKMSTYTKYLKEDENLSPISPYQPLIIVNCTDGKGKIDDDSEREPTNICHFTTSILTDKDTFILREEESYNQYLLQGEKNKYKVIYEGITNVKKVYLDLSIFSGDVRFEMDSKIDVHKYFLSNKIFYSITVDQSAIIKEIAFNVVAAKNSFYLISYQIVKENDDKLNTNFLEAGASYLVSVDPSTELKSKFVKVNNPKRIQGFPFLVNFYSLNCKFKVTKIIQDEDRNEESKEIEVVGNYGQEIISQTDLDYLKEYYEYKVEIVEEDNSNFSRKLCMVYVSGLNLEQTNTGMESTLSIPEGVPQQFIFKEGFNKMRYNYYVSDLTRNIIVYFNLIDKAPYKVDIYFGYVKSTITQTFSRTTQILVAKGEWNEYCKEGEICAVTIDINLDTENMKTGLEPRLETTVRQIEGPPVYLQKNVLKIDIAPGNTTKYYFVDLGKNEEGDVTINYRRGSGKIFGRIVQKNQTIADENADWREMYRFPQTIEDSLRYEGYLKKLTFGSEQTEGCEEGCYLLLSVYSSVIGEATGEYRFYPFSIIVRVSPGERTYEDVPKINMLINEYIIGNIATSQHERMYEFYQIWLPYDADEVIIDWQSDRPSLFINVGDKRPTTLDADFKFESIGHDTIFKMSKTDILNVAKKNGIIVPNQGSIKDIQLVFGIWTDQVDTLYTSVYSMKVHLAFENQIDIYHIKTDQKVLCEPTPIGNNSYRCLFAIILEGIDIISNITVLPKPQDESASYNIYGNYIDAKKIDENDYDYLSKNIPNAKNAEFNTEKTGSKFLYIVHQKYEKYVFFSVVIDKPCIIELLSSVDLDDEEIAPNPSTAQLFSIQDKKFAFNFATSEDLLINFVSVNGKAEIYWEKEPDIIFYLQGRDDRLTMTSGTSQTENRYSRLIIESKTELNEGEDPGFVFYVTYYPRSQLYNFDQLKIGKSVEFNYRDSDFPINFFVKINDLNKDISANLNFYHLDDSQSRTRFFNPGKMLTIWGTIITSKEAYEARLNDDNRPQKSTTSILGVYNGELNAASIFFSSKDLKSFNINMEDEPTLFFTVEKSNDVKFIFRRISMEVTILQQGINIPATEKVYQFGKLAHNEEFGTFYNTYILTTNKQKPYMRIEYAANSGYFDWSISRKAEARQNDTFEEFYSEYANGRTLVTFKVPTEENLQQLHLNVFIEEEGAEVEPKLGNYIFKYINGPNNASFYDYKVVDDNLDIIKVPNPIGGGNNYSITFNAVPGTEKCNVSYIFRGVSKISYIQHEAIETIAFTESEGFSLQIDNPPVDSEGRITIEAYAILMNPRYFSVMAKIKDKTINEYIMYQPEIYWDLPEEHPGTEELIEITYDIERDYTSYWVKDAFKKQKYKLIFTRELPNYVKIEVETGEAPNQIIYFSPSDENCMNDRQQLSQKGAGKIVTMWLKKEQFSKKDLFIAVECQNTKGSCNYELRFTAFDSIEVDSNFIYSYYVTENNKEMTFHISKSLMMDSDNTDTTVTIYGKGSQNIDLKIDGVTSSPYKFRFGTAMTFNPPSSHTGTYYELKVTAKEREYITVGTKVVTNGRSGGNLLQPNSAEVTGFLVKGLLEEECYSISDLNSKEYEEVEEIYITGIFYNRIANVYLRDTDYKEIELSELTVETGSYFYIFDVRTEQSNKKDFYVCVRFPLEERFDIQYIPYSLQITEPLHHVGLSNIYSPQGNGIIYPRLLPKNSIVYFSGVTTSEGAKKISYNMQGINGFPKMYIHKCTTYPLCRYTDDILENDSVIQPHNVNRMSTWVTKEITTSPISPEQYVIIAKCVDGYTTSSEICGFQTSIFSDKDEVLLIEGEPFSQNLKAKEKHSFLIDFAFEKNIQKVHLDTLVINGDVTFTLKNKNNSLEIAYHKYYLANKIFFSINLNDNKGLNKIYMDIEATTNSYYIIDYKLVRKNDDEFINYINSGINYLVSIDPSTKEKNKKIKIMNLKVGDGNPFLTNFYSLNCKFNIENEWTTKKDSQPTRKEINLYDNYAQQVLTNDSIEYEMGIYSYIITIKEEDKSKYERKMCMLYVTGIEASAKNTLVEREIIVSQNIPQRIIFEKGIKKIRYLYPHSTPNDNLSVNLNLLDIAKYKVTIFYEYQKSEEIEVTRSKIINLNKQEWKSSCENQEICNVIVEIELEETIIEKQPLLEFSIRPISNIVSYLPKGIAKRDFVVNNKGLFFYTDIGEEEMGEITVDFLRGSGKVFGKIVNKNQDKPDENPNWRQMYKIPTTEEESQLTYDGYLKKLYVFPDDTIGCSAGCYLVLFINSTLSGLMDLDLRVHPFTITASITPAQRIYTDIPKIIIKADEHVVGNVAKATSERIYEFYEIFLPHDAEAVEFDWQSDVAELYVNVGDERPTKMNAHFKLGSNGTDTIMKISKEAILKLADNYLIPVPIENSLKNLNLVIGIWTDKTDSVSTTVYSLRVHLPVKKEGEDEIDIFEVNSDQKNLCKPKKISNNEYRCLYIVLYEELDAINNLILYAESQNKAANTFMFANIIEEKIYETYDVKKLTQNIPTNENAKYNNKKDHVNYIFVSDPKELKTHLFVSVVSDKEDVIEFMSSFYTYEKVITPNPSTVQLFSVLNEELTLDFSTSEDIIINIVGLAGESEIYWEKEKNVIYNLRGKDDRLTLTSGRDFLEGKNSKLIIRNRKKPLRLNTEKEIVLYEDYSKMNDPGFTFYLSYYIRTPLINFDEIYSGKSLEMAYRSTDFPIFLYSKIGDTNHDVNIVLNFRGVEDIKKNEKKIFRESKFSINGAVIKEDSVYTTKINPDLRPSISHSVIGIFDPAIKTAQVFLSQQDLSNYKIVPNEKPTIYFSMDKTKYGEDIKYDRFSFDVSIIKENEGIPVTEKVYQFGKLGKNKQQNNYKLRNNKNTPYMRIQFSTNNYNINFAINFEEGKQTNSTLTDLKEKIYGGKSIVTFKTPNEKDFIYLTVFIEDKDTVMNGKLTNYVFKYINAEDPSLYKEYATYKDNNKISYYTKEINDSFVDLKILFNKLVDTKANITYSVRIVPTETAIKDEVYNTIALTESPSIVVQYLNPKPLDNGTIILTAEQIPKEFTTLQVIAQVLDETITEYVAYNGIGVPYERKINEKSGTSIPLWVLVLIGAILFIIVIILVIVVLSCRAKNQDLMYKVSKISFQESMGGGDTNLLLNDNDNNALN